MLHPPDPTPSPSVTTAVGSVPALSEGVASLRSLLHFHPLPSSLLPRSIFSQIWSWHKTHRTEPDCLLHAESFLCTQPDLPFRAPGLPLTQWSAHCCSHPPCPEVSPSAWKPLPHFSCHHHLPDFTAPPKHHVGWETSLQYPSFTQKM